jgi:hypothetical protein
MLQMAKSIPAQLSMFSLWISEASPDAISSLASPSGTTPWLSPTGLLIAPSGPAPVPANLSARQAKAAGSMMSGTYGPHGTISSASADLQRSLASRLRVRTASVGSTLFTLTWKERATPSGRLICALRASALRISGSGSGSWPTPQTHDSSGAKTPEQIAAIRARCKAEGKGSPGFANLNEVVMLASWITPAAREAGGTPEQFLARKVKARENGAELGISLTSLSLQAQLLAWATPAARDYRFANAKSFAERGGGKKGEQLNNQVVHSGPTPIGSHAETGKPGQLNPAHSR